jgi:hypothetical protein
MKVKLLWLVVWLALFGFALASRRGVLAPIPHVFVEEESNFEDAAEREFDALNALVEEDSTFLNPHAKLQQAKIHGVERKYVFFLFSLSLPLSLAEITHPIFRWLDDVSENAVTNALRFVRQTQPLEDEPPIPIFGKATFFLFSPVSSNLKNVFGQVADEKRMRLTKLS